MKAIVHNSASEWGHQSIIDTWHRKRWGDRLRVKDGIACGYHVVILNGLPTSDHIGHGDDPDRVIKILDGQIEIGRPLDADDELEAHEIGAHAYGFNRDTLSVCLIGDNYFTRNQIVSLIKVLKWWDFHFRIRTRDIMGHYELPNTNKSCPNLDMNRIRKLYNAKTDSMRLLGGFNNLKEVA